MESKLLDPKLGELLIKSETKGKLINITAIHLTTKQEKSANSTLSENEYHIGVRRMCLKRGGKILNGSKVVLNGNHSLNKFEECIEEAKIVEDNNNSTFTGEQN